MPIAGTPVDCARLAPAEKKIPQPSSQQVLVTRMTRCMIEMVASCRSVLEVTPTARAKQRGLAAKSAVCAITK